MAELFNTDFQDFLRALNAAEVRYILVGGYSVVLHGYSRTTGDMDVWVEQSADNYARLVQAFRLFGMPVFDMSEGNFLHNPTTDVFSFGRPPSAIDLMTAVKGLAFPAAFVRASFTEVDGLPVRLIDRQDLITAKKAAGRNRDLDDLEHLPKHPPDA